VRSRPRAACAPSQFWAGYTTNTFEFEFPTRTPVPSSPWSYAACHPEGRSRRSDSSDLFCCLEQSLNIAIHWLRGAYRSPQM
jgi:hypothetical protein